MRKRIAGYIGVSGTSTLGLTNWEWSCVRKQATGRRGGEKSIVEERKRYSEGVRQDRTLPFAGSGNWDDTSKWWARSDGPNGGPEFS
jgi:hypothetical protein